MASIAEMYVPHQIILCWKQERVAYSSMDSWHIIVLILVHYIPVSDNGVVLHRCFKSLFLLTSMSWAPTLGRLILGSLHSETNQWDPWPGGVNHQRHILMSSWVWYKCLPLTKRDVQGSQECFLQGLHWVTWWLSGWDKSPSALRFPRGISNKG